METKVDLIATYVYAIILHFNWLFFPSTYLTITRYCGNGQDKPEA